MPQWKKGLVNELRAGDGGHLWRCFKVCPLVQDWVLKRVQECFVGFWVCGFRLEDRLGKGNRDWESRQFQSAAVWVCGFRTLVLAHRTLALGCSLGPGLEMSGLRKGLLGFRVCGCTGFAEFAWPSGAGFGFEVVRCVSCSR